jgi:hypothetical protein
MCKNSKLYKMSTKYTSGILFHTKDELLEKLS